MVCLNCQAVKLAGVLLKEQGCGTRMVAQQIKEEARSPNHNHPQYSEQVGSKRVVEPAVLNHSG